MADLRIGCSGFLYDHWRGNFYPEELSRNQWFEYYTKHFNTVELNVTFYRLPERESFLRWYATTPDNFLFSVKGSRFITHVKKLKDCSEPLEAFFSRASLLKEKLGVVLWQLPPNFACDIDRFKNFLEILKPFGVKSTFEFRNKTWINKKISSLFEKENIAYCMADSPEFLEDLPITADFVYIRRHGKDGRYASCYTTEELKKDAKFIKTQLKNKKDVFVYFNNDVAGYAPKNAKELISLVNKKVR